MKTIAFLSSTRAEFERARCELYDWNPSIWIAEFSAPELDFERDREGVLDRCLDEVKNAPAFILLIGKNYGMSKSVFDGTATDVSLVEMEVFQALIDRKPIRVFVPGGELTQSKIARLAAAIKDDPLVQTIAYSLPESQAGADISSNDLISKIKRELRPYKRFKMAFALAIPARFKLLFQRPYRQFLQSVIDDTSPPILGRKIRPAGGNGVSDVIVMDGIPGLLDQAVSTAHQAGKLARIWAALRTLDEVAHYTEEHCADYLQLWNRALTLWGSASAWYGLHGIGSFSALAANRALVEVRSRMLAEGLAPPGNPDFINGLKGGLASEIYSIAKSLPRSSIKKQLFKKSLSLLDEVLSTSPPSSAGFRAIKGSVFLQLGDKASAIREYRASLDERISSGASAASIGETEAELGFAMLLSGDVKQGCALMERGVSAIATSDAYPFTVRARRKLAVGYALSMRPLLAWREISEAYALADVHGIDGFLRSPVGRVVRLIRGLRGQNI